MRLSSVCAVTVLFAACGLASAAEAPEPWRGVHVMAWGSAGGESGIPALIKAIDEMLVPMGINVMIYEVDYNFAFDSHPELRFPELTSKEGARDLARFCRERGIRLIPQFNCLGHQSWTRRNMIFPLMTEYPEMEEVNDLPPDQREKRMKSWCPLHPDVNTIAFALMDEIVDAFEADAIHVGMDEVLTIASPACPRCAGKDPTELFAKAVNDYHDHLVKKRGLTMLMWGDRLLDASADAMGNGWEASDVGTAGAIDLVPRDIVICDWHYSLQDDYPSVRLFQEKGFRVWPAGWKDSEAAVALVDCAKRDGSDKMLGYLGTSWVLEAGDFANALLGATEPERIQERAVPAAAALKAAMERLRVE